MSQFNTPAPVRSGGSLDVYTVMLLLAMLLLAGGVTFMVLRNMEHAADREGGQGGAFTLVESR